MTEPDLPDIAGADRILLALDYDGTLVPITGRPEDARPTPDLIDLLAGLAAAPGVTVLLLSGRPADVLAAWIPDPGIAIAGAHGGEYRPPDGERRLLLAPEEALSAASGAAEILTRALRDVPGAIVEPKSVGVAAHFRLVAASRRAEFHRLLDRALHDLPSPFERHEGKCVVELRWPGVSKGAALTEIRRRLGLTAVPVLALGDDRTDEETFASLSADDVSVHVGEGPSSARLRIRDVAAARRFLGRVLEHRRRGRERSEKRRPAR